MISLRFACLFLNSGNTLLPFEHCFLLWYKPWTKIWTWFWYACKGWNGFNFWFSIFFLVSVAVYDSILEIMVSSIRHPVLSFSLNLFLGFQETMTSLLLSYNKYLKYGLPAHGTKYMSLPKGNLYKHDAVLARWQYSWLKFDAEDTLELRL